MIGLGFFLSLFLLKMPLASVLVMVFLLARVVNYLSKSQRALQQVAVRESAYWSLIEAIAAAAAQVEPRGGQAAPRLAESIRFDDVGLQPRRRPPPARPRLVRRFRRRA